MEKTAAAGCCCLSKDSWPTTGQQLSNDRQRSVFNSIYWFSVIGKLTGCAHRSVVSLCDLMDCSPPGSVRGILQARTLEYAAISSCKGSSRPREGSNLNPRLLRCRQILYLLSHQGSNIAGSFLYLKTLSIETCPGGGWGGGPAVKTSPSNAGSVDAIPVWRPKIPKASWPKDRSNTVTYSIKALKMVHVKKSPEKNVLTSLLPSWSVDFPYNWEGNNQRL